MLNTADVPLLNFTGPTPVSDADSIYLRFEWILAAFYLIRPSRTMVATVEEVPQFFNMVVSHAPCFFGTEMILLWMRKKPSYRWADSLVGFAALMTSAIPLAFMETYAFAAYSWVYERYRVIDLPYDSMWTWAIALAAIDLSQYCVHRSVHEFNVMWAGHQLHHSTENYTFASGVRFTFCDKMCLLIYIFPWCVLVPPAQALAHHQLNLIYQLWVHTRFISSFGPFDRLIFAPGSHEVHHGANRFCIDKNYGGLLSIWDQLFGTMVFYTDHTDKTIYPGLVHPLKTHDVGYIFGWSWRDIYRRIRSYDKFSDKLGVLFKGPGWAPGKPRLGNIEEIPEIPECKDTYEKSSPYYMYVNLAIHLYMMYFISTTVTRYHKILPYWQQIVAHVFVVWTSLNTGYVLEHKWYSPYSEFFRCAMYFVLELILGDLFVAAFGHHLQFFRVYVALSVIFWTFNLGRFSGKPAQKVD